MNFLPHGSAHEYFSRKSSIWFFSRNGALTWAGRRLSDSRSESNVLIPKAVCTQSLHCVSLTFWHQILRTFGCLDVIIIKLETVCESLLITLFKTSQARCNLCFGSEKLVFGHHKFMNPSSRENWRFSNWIRSEFGTTYASRCSVLVWRDHTIDPKTNLSFE